MGMLTQSAQYKMNLQSGYDREVLKQGALSDEKKKTSAKSGKQIPQLGEQKNQSVPPLIVESDIDKAFKADIDKDYDLLDPIIIQSAKRLNMSVTQAKETAARVLSLCQMFGIEEVPRGRYHCNMSYGGLRSVLRRKPVYQHKYEICSTGTRCT
jgi:hypothetical protein